MATVLHRTTKQLIPSANTPEHPVGQWIINPDLSAVMGFATKYWIITGDTVTLMSLAQRNTVDAAELAAARDSIAAQMDALEEYARAFALVVLDELNVQHTVKTNAILSAIDGATTYANLRTAIAAIADVPTRTIAQLKTAVRSKLGT